MILSHLAEFVCLDSKFKATQETLSSDKALKLKEAQLKTILSDLEEKLQSIQAKTQKELHKPFFLSMSRLKKCSGLEEKILTRTTETRAELALVQESLQASHDARLQRRCIRNKLRVLFKQVFAGHSEFDQQYRHIAHLKSQIKSLLPELIVLDRVKADFIEIQSLEESDPDFIERACQLYQSCRRMSDKTPLIQCLETKSLVDPSTLCLNICQGLNELSKITSQLSTTLNSLERASVMAKCRLYQEQSQAFQSAILNYRKPLETNELPPPYDFK